MNISTYTCWICLKPDYESDYGTIIIIRTIIFYVVNSLNHHLLGGETLGERLYNDTCHETEEQTEGNRDREGGQSFAPNGQQQKGQAQTDENCYETRNCCIPVTVAGRFADQHGVEDEVTQAQFDST